MSVPKIRSVRLLSATALFDGSGNGGTRTPPADVVPPRGSGSSAAEVVLEDGGASTFALLSPQDPRRILAAAGAGFLFGTPVLFVAKLDDATVGEAAEAMVREMSGYWLRYYKSPDGTRRILGGENGGEGGSISAVTAEKGKDKARGGGRSAGKGAMPLGGRRVAATELTDIDQPGRPDNACAVNQAVLRDGRRFSLLTASPSWFETAFAEFGLRYYFGPQILFLRAVERRLAREAVREMSAAGDRWFCVYDTPRTTLPRVLADFKSRHP